MIVTIRQHTSQHSEGIAGTAFPAPANTGSDKVSAGHVFEIAHRGRIG
jgi:hypothetical protein